MLLQLKLEIITRTIPIITFFPTVCKTHNNKNAALTSFPLGTSPSFWQDLPLEQYDKDKQLLIWNAFMGIFQVLPYPERMATSF